IVTTATRRRPSSRRPSSAPSKTSIEGPSARREGSSRTRSRRSVNAFEPSSWIGTALSETMTSELSMGEELRTISADDVVRMKRDLGLAAADGIGPEALLRVGKHLGTQLVVTGAYLAVGGKIRVDLRLFDTTTGQTIATLSESGVEGELIDIVARSGAA